MVGIAAAIAIPLIPAPPAGASHAGAVKSKTVSISYSPALHFNSRPLHRCVTIVLGGFIRYRFLESAGTSSWRHVPIPDRREREELPGSRVARDLAWIRTS